MKKIILLVSLFLSLGTHALDISLADCEKQGRTFGSGEGKDYIDPSCLSFFSKQARQQSIRGSADGKIKIIAHKNMVIINDPKVPASRQNVIAGSYTELEDAIAVAFSEEKKEIFVLEEKGDILIFSSVITGNVAPKRIIKHPEFEGASDLIFNPKTSEIVVLNTKSKEIHSVSAKANSQGKEIDKKFSVRTIVTNHSGQQLALSKNDQLLAVLMKDKKSIKVFSLTTMMGPKDISLIESVDRIDYTSANDLVVKAKEKTYKAPVAFNEARKAHRELPE